MATADHSLQYRADVDGLRATAIVAVVAYHAGIPGFGAGYLGVDVFFVISGFLITSLLWAEQLGTGKIAIGAFYARRARRLLPALAVVLVAVAVAGLLLMGPGYQLRDLGKQVSSAAVFGSNILFSFMGGYFAAPAQNLPLLHTWTLAVEEQFYLVWPVLLILFGRFVPDTKRRARGVVTALVALALLSWAGTFFRPVRFESLAFYLSPFRGWEFGAGALLAFLPTRFRRPNPWLQLAALAALLVCLGLNQKFPAAGLVALATVGSTALLIAAGGGQPKGLAAMLLTFRPVVAIGLVSYGWYLWHWPVLSIVRVTTVTDVDPVRDGLLSLGTLGLAVLTWVFIERPIRQQKIPVFRSTTRSLKSGAAIVLAGLLMGALLYGVGSLPLKSGSAAAQVDAARPYHTAAEYYCAKDPTKPQNCTFGAPQARETILLAGDSHGAMIRSGLVEVARTTGRFRLVSRTLTACRPVQHASPVAERCLQQNRTVVAETPALAADGLKGVVLGAYWGAPEFNDIDQLAPQVQAWRRLGVRVAVVAESPILPHSPRDCVLHRPASYCSMTRAVFETQRAQVMRKLRDATAGDPGVRLFDLSATYCDEATCTPLRNGTLHFYDRDHLTVEGGKSLAPAMREMTDWLLAGSPN